MIELITRNQYRNKNASIAKTNKQIDIFISYETIIAASINGITFLTSKTYSNTTAHHKTDAVRYFNNASIIEVTPDTLYKIANGDDDTRTTTIEEETQKQLLTSHVLKENKYNCIAEHEAFINNHKLINDKSTNYKNGNRLNVRIYQTTFKNIPNFYIKCKTRYIKTTITKNGNKYKYYKTKKYPAVIYSY